MRVAWTRLRSTPAASLEQRPRHYEMNTNNEDVEFSPHDVSEHSDLSMLPRILTRQDFSHQISACYISLWTLT